MKENVRKEIGRVSLLILVLYGVIVIYFVLFSDRLGRTEGYEGYRYNLVLFGEIRRFIRYREYVSPGAFILNLVGNLMVLFPVGFLIPLLRMGKTGVLRILVWSFLLSLGIELLQLVSRVGVFDVDDLFLNTLGSILGYYVYRILGGLYHRRLRHDKKDGL